MSIVAFPNPTVKTVTLKIGFEDLAGIEYTLLTIDGRIIAKRSIVQKESEISFSDLPPSIYVLRVTGGQISTKTFKIIKR